MLQDYLVYIDAEELKLLVTHHIQAILTFVGPFILIVRQSKENILEDLKLNIILLRVIKRKHGAEMITKAFFFLPTIGYGLNIRFFIMKSLPYLAFLKKIWPFKNVMI